MSSSSNVVGPPHVGHRGHFERSYEPVGPVDDDDDDGNNSRVAGEVDEKGSGVPP